jgi:hypothetical protein
MGRGVAAMGRGGVARGRVAAWGRGVAAWGRGVAAGAVGVAAMGRRGRVGRGVARGRHMGPPWAVGVAWGEL